MLSTSSSHATSYWQGGRPSASGSGTRMKGLATWRAATRTHAFRETEDSPLFQLLFGSECGCTLISILLVTTRMNYSLVSNASFKLHTEDMSNFQPFLGRKGGHDLNSCCDFPSLTPVGRYAPGKACASSIDLDPTLVPCPEETWK